MHRKRIILVALAAFILLLFAAAWWGNRALKARNHPGLRTFIGQIWRNYPASFAVEPPVLDIRVEDRDMETLDRAVEEARARGVILPEGRPYVPAQIGLEGAEFKARIRIKGKMTDHVKGSKWSFRVQARKDGGFLGMQRFSLQHPGTRNYLCDWFFHRLMAGEGAVALRYGFIRVHFNGEDLGVYAYEEHFGPELLARSRRIKGPLFRFDPALYWQHRLNAMKGIHYEEAFAAYQAAGLDAFGEGALEKDPEQLRLFEEALALMHAFRTGRLPASAVFDVEGIARRHAILDLVGGHHSMDWSDVKFYYDPVRGRIEPVAYESFSTNKIRKLAGSDRYQGRFQEGGDLHYAYFNDTAIFRAYVRNLERVSRASYLDSAFQVLKPALDSASAILYREFPYKELDRSIYYHNQATIRRLLDVPKGFHAHRQGFVADTLGIALIPVEALPMEVHGLRLGNGVEVALPVPFVLPVRGKGLTGRPVQLQVALPVGTPASALDKLEVIYSVLGASVRKATAVSNAALIPAESLPAYRDRLAPAMQQQQCLVVDEAARTVVFKPGRWAITSDIVIPAGYKVMGTAPLELDMLQGARLVCRSPLTLKGMEELPVRVLSSDSSSAEVLIDTEGEVLLHQVLMGPFGPAGEGGRPGLTVLDAMLDLRNVSVAGDRRRGTVLLVRVKGAWQGGRVQGGRDQLEVAYSDLRMQGITLQGAGDDALLVRGGALHAKGLVVKGADGSGVKLVQQAFVKLEAPQVKADKEAVTVEDGSRLEVLQGALRSKGLALMVSPASIREGTPEVNLTGTMLEGSQPIHKVGEGARVKLDGRDLPAAKQVAKP